MKKSSNAVLEKEAKTSTNSTEEKDKYVIEKMVKKEVMKSLNWGWFKFAKCLLGLFIFALGINLFIVPNNLYTGGILGIAQLIRTAIVSIFHIETNIDISSIIYYIINIPLFVFSYKKMSKTFFYRTLFGATFSSIFLAIIPIPKEPLMNSILANTLIGGMLSGIGIGMVLSTGSSTGGTDIIGIDLSQKNSIFTVGNIGLFFNIIIYGICGFLYGVEVMLYSIFYSVFETIMTDRNHMQNINSAVVIFTKKHPQKIIEFINSELKRGATYWEAIGGYTNTKTYIVYSALSKYERMRLERHIKEFDINAFMVENDGLLVKGDFDKYLI